MSRVSGGIVPSLLLSTAVDLLSGKVTSQQLVVTAIKKASLDVNKNVTLDTQTEHDSAVAKAATIDGRRRAGNEKMSLVAGIPVSIKDNFNMTGSPTTAGSRMLKNYISTYDSTVVARLREADAIPCLKANMDEFGMGSSMLNSAYGACSNPWTVPGAAPLSPGGSSGASACAVASGMVSAAIGSDTGGSVRLPASFCGVVGFKPTYGTISRHGLVAYASSMDTPGVIAQCVFDAALLYDIIGGYDCNDSNSVGSTSQRSTPSSSSSSAMTYASDLLHHCNANSAPLYLHDVRGAAPALQSLGAKCSLKGVVVGVIDEFILSELGEDTRRAWETSVQMLVDAGATVKNNVSVPSLKLALPAYYVLACAEASSNLSRYDGIRYGARASGAHDDFLSEVARSRGRGFGPEVVRRLLTGTYVLTASAADTYYLKACKARALLKRELSSCFTEQGITVCVCPTSPHPPYQLQSPPDSADLLLNDVFTVPANLASLPSISVPVATGRARDTGALYPIGIQVIAAPMAERSVLRAALAIEQRADFSSMIPPHVVLQV